MGGVNLPPYAQIAAELRDQINNGTLAPGDRVPSTREITQRWGVAMATATKALAALRQEGIVRPVPGVGTVVGGARNLSAFADKVKEKLKELGDAAELPAALEPKIRDWAELEDAPRMATARRQ